MINLLPDSARKEVARSYRLRVIVLSTLLFAVALAIIIVVLVAFSIVISIEKKALEDITREGTQDSLLVENLKTLEDIRTKIDLLGLTPADGGDVDRSVLLARIIEKRGPGVRIDEVQITKNEAGSGISIRGFATTRDGFIAYVNALEADEELQEVTYPISSLSKPSDISFVINLSAPSNESAS